jgi:hypothetical protein
MSAFATSRPVNPPIGRLIANAQALFREGRYAYEQAYLLYQQAYEGLMVTHGEDDRSTLTTMFNMSLALLHQKKYVEAHSMF